MSACCCIIICLDIYMALGGILTRLYDYDSRLDDIIDTTNAFAASAI